MKQYNLKILTAVTNKNYQIIIYLCRPNLNFNPALTIATILIQELLEKELLYIRGQLTILMG